MKDKLTKTGHKKPYYRMKSLLRITGLTLALGLSTATPILITYGVENSRAEAAKEAESSSECSTESEVLSFFAEI